jgi:hypothetical protein
LQTTWGGFCARVVGWVVGGWAPCLVVCGYGMGGGGGSQPPLPLPLHPPPPPTHHTAARSLVLATPTAVTTVYMWPVVVCTLASVCVHRASPRPQMRAKQSEALSAAAAADAERARAAEAAHASEIQRRMHPRTAADFEILYNELEAWRTAETARIAAQGLEERDRLEVGVACVLLPPPPRTFHRHPPPVWLRNVGIALTPVLCFFAPPGRHWHSFCTRKQSSYKPLID